jgi:hypothetical protein
MTGHDRHINLCRNTDFFALCPNPIAKEQEVLGRNNHLLVLSFDTIGTAQKATRPTGAGGVFSAVRPILKHVEILERTKILSWVPMEPENKIDSSGEDQQQFA